VSKAKAKQIPCGNDRKNGKNNSNRRSFAHHPQAEKRLGPLSLRMTALFELRTANCSIGIVAYFELRTANRSFRFPAGMTERKARTTATADPSLTTSKLKNAWGPFRSG
jgi:hypothetical protein